MFGKQNRFDVNIDELRQFNPKLATFVLRQPIEAIKIFEDSLNATVRGLKENDGKLNNEKTAQAADAFFP
jgi:DNA replication licensing factor MCM3